MSEPSTFSVRGEGARITVDVYRYTYSGASDVSDANWVSSRIDCDIYGCRLRIDATLTTADFRDFLRDLEAAIEGGTATFETIEDWLRLKFVVQGTGRAIVEGEVGNPGWPTLRLRFEFESDQTYFRETIRELRAVCASFPVIEKV